MNQLTVIFISIPLLFALLLLVKELFSMRICALCASISLTWIVLFILLKIGIFGNQLIVGIMIGESITGIYYLIEKRAQEHWKIFLLPFFLTLTTIGYTALAETIPLGVILTIAALWAIAFCAHQFRERPQLKEIAQKIIQCCKNW